MLNSKNSLQILDCILFDVKDGVLTLTASDKENELTTSVELDEADSDGRFAISSRTIIDAGAQQAHAEALAAAVPGYVHHLRLTRLEEERDRAAAAVTGLEAEVAQAAAREDSAVADLDLLRADGSFVSFMTQDIDSITYEREGDGTAFTHMTV